MIEPYLQKIEALFAPTETDIQPENPALRKTWELCQAFEGNWNDLLSSLKAANPGRIKLVPSSGSHAFSAVFTYGREGAEPAGFVLSISPAFDAIGYWFYEYVVSTKTNFEVVSGYRPLDPQMSSLWKSVHEQVLQYFPSFTLFPEQFADYKITEVEIDGRARTNLDLWQVLFNSNPNIV